MVKSNNENILQQDTQNERLDKKMIFIQYRGKITEKYVEQLKKSGAPVNPILTMKKVSTELPSLKEKVEKVICSSVVYKFECSNCKVSYVGMTSRHLLTRFREHCSKKESSIYKHTKLCHNEPTTIEDFTILHKTRKNIIYLSVLEALYIREFKPFINEKDEFRSRHLRLKI